ncbi:DUF6070 family protein [Eisenbergiella tayi]|uniref:ATP F0F1 synthase subunit B n=1 Tax=Eisenbergiella tayi TaxID=1432052 RepID=A0A1E3AF09_9FIRM|nr:DUF6070 family protein [Eisenbergiella tayi]ODM07269.1 hypothetical protein BEI61_03159 [Eisenbergiella tayi]
MKKIEWPEKTKGLLLLLLLLFVTAAFLLKEEPAYTLTTEEAREPEALGAFDAEADGTGSEAAETISLLTEEELKQLKKEALEAAEYCRELYKDIRATERESEGENNTFLLTREQQTAITARLGELGLVSAADNINMVNYEKVEDFYAAYQEGKDALVTIFYVDPEGGMSALTFVYRKSGLQMQFTAIGWDKGGNPEIMGSGTNNLKEMKLTGKGYLIYTNEEVVAHGNLREYFRVKPLSGECRKLTETYVSGLSYVDYKLLVTDWNSSNVEEILTPSLFEDLYRIYYGENVKPERDRIPADIYEEVMTACLPVTPEQLRQHCGYDEGSRSYPYEKILPRQHPPFGEVVDYTRNADGTITLIVDGVWPDYNSDCAFTNRLLVQPQKDGSFRYLSNSIEEKELKIPVSD